jgi:hypothetical protein
MYVAHNSEIIVICLRIKSVPKFTGTELIRITLAVVCPFL